MDQVSIWVISFLPNCMVLFLSNYSLKDKRIEHKTLLQKCTWGNFITFCILFFQDMNEVSSFIKGSKNGCAQNDLNYPPFTPSKSIYFYQKVKYQEVYELLCNWLQGCKVILVLFLWGLNITIDRKYWYILALVKGVVYITGFFPFSNYYWILSLP